MSEFITSQLSLLVSALNFSAIVFLLGYGLSLIYSSLNFMNLAHASFFTVASFLTTTVVATVAGYVSAGIFGVLVVLLAVIFVIPLALMALSIGLKETVLDRISTLDEPSQLLGTFAVLFILEDAMRFVWGTGTLRASFPGRALGSIQIGSARVSSVMVISILLGAIAVVLLYLLFTRSKLGNIIIALAEDPEIVRISGINARMIHYQIYAIGTVLAALGGALWVMNFSITIGLTLRFVLLAFAVVVIGGVGSLGGAVIASLLIGLIRTFGVRFIGGFDMAIIFLLMAVVIIVNPTGIGGVSSK